MGATAAVSDAGRDLFLAGVERALQPLDDPAEIMATVARLVGERLACDRCAYAEAEPDEDHFTMTGSYARGLPPLTGRMAMSDFSAEALRCMRAGEPYVVVEAFTDPRVLPGQRDIYRRTGITAVVCVPLHKSGRFVAAMAVHHATPRVWTAAEIELLTTVVARCWESLQRVHALNALRENEERYRLIVERASDGVADVLQRSLLPRELPPLARLAAAARFLAAEPGGRRLVRPVPRRPPRARRRRPRPSRRAAAASGEAAGGAGGTCSTGTVRRRARTARPLRRALPGARAARGVPTLDWLSGELRWACRAPAGAAGRARRRGVRRSAGPCSPARPPPFARAATITAGTSVLLHRRAVERATVARRGPRPAGDRATGIAS